MFSEAVTNWAIEHMASTMGWSDREFAIKMARKLWDESKGDARCELVNCFAEHDARRVRAERWGEVKP